MQEVIMTTISKTEFQEIIKREIASALSSLPKSEPVAVEDEFINIDQLCEYLKCSKSTVRNYKMRRVIPYYQTGRKVYFKKSEVDAALAIQMPKRK